MSRVLTHENNNNIKYNSGVSFQKADTEQYHVGVVYTSSEDDSTVKKVLNLAGHLDLRSVNLNTAKRCVILPTIPSSLARQISVTCRAIWTKNSENLTPYALSPPSDCFNPLSGDLTLKEDQIGLTCATFVLSVYFSLNIPVLDHNTWLVREDDRKWQEYVIENYLPAWRASEEHIEQVLEEVGNIRVRPEEVAGAAIVYPPTVEFDEAIVESQKIVAEYHKSYNI